VDGRRNEREAQPLEEAPAIGRLPQLDRKTARKEQFDRHPVDEEGAENGASGNATKHM
jgi:hypothetical protein